VAKWLFEEGAAEDIRTKSHIGWTPLTAACSSGSLDVAKWLFEVGAAEDIRTTGGNCLTPMIAACSSGRLDVVKWLFEVGDAHDIRTTGNIGVTPLSSASSNTQDSTVLWLVLQGAANDDTSGHVDSAILAHVIDREAVRAAFRQNLAALLDQHATFARVVLPATRTAQAASAEAVPSTRYALLSKKPRARQGLSPLALLCGHEDTLLALIADFVGVARGRQLRNAREAFDI
jgi:hypothetical protein